MNSSRCVLPFLALPYILLIRLPSRPNSIQCAGLERGE